MKKIYLLFSLVLTYSFSFSQTFSFTYKGQVRSYIVHLPTGYVQGEELPLVLNFHGYTSNAGQQESLSGFDNVADTNFHSGFDRNAVDTLSKSSAQRHGVAREIAVRIVWGP